MAIDAKLCRFWQSRRRGSRTLVGGFGTAVSELRAYHLQIAGEKDLGAERGSVFTRILIAQVDEAHEVSGAGVRRKSARGRVSSGSAACESSFALGSAGVQFSAQFLGLRDRILCPVQV